MNEVKLLSFTDMVSEIMTYHEKFRKKGRTGYARDSMTWIIGCLYPYLSSSDSLHDQPLTRKNNSSKMEGAIKAWKTMRSTPWLEANKNTKKAKQILYKNPRLVEKLRVK